MKPRSPHRPDEPTDGGRRRFAAVAAWLALCAAVLLLVGANARGAQRANRPRIGVLVFDERPENEAALEGVRDGFRLARVAYDELVRRSRGDEKEARRQLRLLSSEHLDLLIAVGDRAATLAAREWPGHVLYTAVSDPDVLKLTSAGNACGTVSRVATGPLLATLRRAAPGARGIGVVVPDGDGSAARAAGRLASAVRSATEGHDGGLSVLRASTTETTAERRASSLLATLRPDAGAIWLPRGVTQEDARALATALADSGVVLAGSRRAHLDAGCALILRIDDRRLGQLAVTQALRVLEGDSPLAIPVRRLARARLEVNLNCAAALGWEPPLALLAGADEVVPRVTRSLR